MRFFYRKTLVIIQLQETIRHQQRDLDEKARAIDNISKSIGFQSAMLTDLRNRVTRLEDAR